MTGDRDIRILRRACVALVLFGLFGLLVQHIR